MLQITSIKNGFMLDHIKAGMGVKIFRYLNLDKLGHQVALIINADSKKMGKKDIIKIENIEKINYTVLGLLSPGITINEVRNEVIVNKIKPELPERVENIIECKNPNCITSDEKYIPHSFTLVG
ncbi:aspartate carbamoyltransferase regulatory chain, allosteric domain protein [Clostridium celatum DSM 1785]|uniref:Aspartate carbamoyltransferase regulatory chain, allosteric domain protein n=1 Tax=Clostridium celatum DSM 1785 TaxID=545697 RepID=L1QF04_9CLOT|nr:aspartate carbamoyltransferase regulatory chain, allosteric domain protein [Clostridium celatum DSM 1785]